MGKIKDLTGQKFGRLIALEAKAPENGYMIWTCMCDCGNTVTVRSNSLLTGKVKSCGCLKIDRAKIIGRARLQDLSGKQFGILKVLRDSGNRAGIEVLWECKCQCGKEILVRGCDLKSNNTRSCGCIKKEAQVKSGEAHIKQLIERNMKEGTNLGILSCGLSKRNRSGFKGVSWSSREQKWEATLMLSGKRYYLGFYENINDAAKARKEAEDKYIIPLLRKHGRKIKDNE